MRQMTRRILNDPALLAARDRGFAHLEGVFSGRAPDRPVFVNGVNAAPAGIDPYEEPEAWVEAALDCLADGAEALLDAGVFRPLCVEYGPYGVHYVDRMFGANVYQGSEGQWWVDCLDAPVGGLRMPDLEADETWALSRRAALAFRNSGVSVPVFSLPTIASALNVATNLYGPALMMAFLDHPEAARRDLGIINDLLRLLHGWYRDNLPEAQLQPVVAAQRCQPPGSGQLCGCTSHLVSAALYEEFVAPLDGALLAVYPRGGMIHLCGRHTQHIPAWRRMSSLRAVQLNDRATEDIEAYFTGLRDDQALYIIPTEEVTVERILSRTNVRRVVIIGEPSSHS